MSRKNSRTTGKSIEETRQYHKCYLRAINNPLRREILRVLKDGYATFVDLQSHTGLDNDTLNWHLNILEHGFCIEKHIVDGNLVYRRTQEGKVVDYMK